MNFINKFSCIATLLTLSAYAPVCAEDAKATPTPRERADAFIAASEGVAESVLGVIHFGFYLHGQQNIGSMKLNTTKCEAGEPGVYKITFDSKLEFGPMQQTAHEVTYLDAAFARVAATSDRVETNTAGELVEVHEESSIKDGKWIFIKVEGEGEAVEHELAATTANYETLPELLFLARALDGSAAGQYEFDSVDLPKLGDGKTEAQWLPLEIEVREAAEVMHRGDAQNAVVFAMKKGQESPMNITVSEAGDVLAFGSDAVPIVIIAGTEEESKQDIAPPAGNAEENDAVRAPVVTYLRVLAKEEPIDALDAIFDWDAIHAGMSKDNPDISVLKTEAFAEVIKEQFDASAAPFTAAELEEAIPLLKIVVDGNSAIVEMAGAEDSPFNLAKGEDGWKITRFPH